MGPVRFHFKVFLGSFFIFIRILIEQTPCVAASDPGLHCLPMPHEKDTRPKWVKQAKVILKQLKC